MPCGKDKEGALDQAADKGVPSQKADVSPDTLEHKDLHIIDRSHSHSRKKNYRDQQQVFRGMEQLSRAPFFRYGCDMRSSDFRLDKRCQKRKCDAGHAYIRHIPVSEAADDPAGYEHGHSIAQSTECSGLCSGFDTVH